MGDQYAVIRYTHKVPEHIISDELDCISYGNVWRMGSLEDAALFLNTWAERQKRLKALDKQEK